MTVGDAQMRREAWGTAHHIAELQEHLATGNALNSKAVQGGPIRKRKMRGTTTQWKWAILAWLVSAAIAATPPDIEVGETRSVYVKGIEFSLSWNLVYTNQTQYTDLGAVLYSRVLWNGEVLGETFSPLYVDALLITSSDLSELKVDSTHLQNIVIEHSFSPTYSDPVSITVPLFFVPGALTLFPPAVVILVAATTREVLYALYLGIFCAAFIVQQYNPFTAFLRTLDKYLVNSLGDVDHAFVILFTWILSGLIANISKSGGSFGIARIFRRFAKSRMSSQLVVFFLGFVIFFDDYANSLILGNTMRVVSDGLWVSREKLCFIVDATTAPVASIAPISSWIGFEVGLIQGEIDKLLAAGEDLEAEGVEINAYLVFLKTIGSRFYPILMLIFMLILIVSRREFGTMLVAERRAQDQRKLVNDTAKLKDESNDDALTPEKGTPLLWFNGVIPVTMVVTLVLLAIMLTGWQETKNSGQGMSVDNIFGNGDSYSSLMYGSFFTTIFSWFMYRFQYVDGDRVVHPFAYWFRGKHAPGHPLVTMAQNVETFIEGVKLIFAPVLVLILAWAIGAAITESGADIFFASALGENVNPQALPVLTFIIAAIISFCTGTSWGTMSILFPLIVPTAWYSSRDADIFYLTISAILAGAVFGDHCTPISDTTILSAIATRCDVVDHTVTQLWYALPVGLVSIFIGYIPVGFDGYTSGIAILLGTVALSLLIIFLGVRVDHPTRKLDLITRAIQFISSKLSRGTEDEEEALEKPVNYYEYDAEYDRTFVDILRPTFWKKSTWKGCCSKSKDVLSEGEPKETQPTRAMANQEEELVET